MAHPVEAVEFIRAKPKYLQPKVGIILGSGLGSLADMLEQPLIIPYAELPGFPISTVTGHAGRMHIGKLQGVPVVCLQGRAHVYEGTRPENIKILIRTLKLLGCEALLLTNAVGSLRKEVGPGQLMMITDHINFQSFNPLVGLNDEEFGPRFFPMDDAYDIELRHRLLDAAHAEHIRLAQGVYISVLGPSFETPAEIRAFRALGADVVGMSTVPEVIIARHCGLKVAAVSAITNYASGMSEEPITHELTLHYGEIAAKDMGRLILKFVESFNE